MIIKVEVAFNLKQIVYLKTDPDQLPRIVTNYIVGDNGVLYELCCGTVHCNHYDFEITTAKTYDLKPEA